MKINFLEKLFKPTSAEKSEAKQTSMEPFKAGIGEIRDTFEKQSSRNDFFSGKFLSQSDLNQDQNYNLPEKGDEVLVAFEKGDTRSPYLIGNLWNTNDKPSETDEGNEQKKPEPEKKDS
jgi:hypothetical protein